MAKKIEMPKRGAGQPPKYTNDQLKDKCSEYLDFCTTSKKMPNRAGFCYFSNISRQTYYNLKANVKYVDTIKHFEQAVEDTWVDRLSGSSATGAIFFLKNAFSEDYKDRVETDITTQGQPIQIYLPQR